ncbi:hypothetical protein SSS_01391 [Sarcoptes scabiei]|uniref:Uncharacterized protein n=1 Tax=Sarcoptes scabiei TaxID=52283 RepID=A0A834R5X4_SARSC|nr:hypothetical protein SSS_01391 [Sarcoptes scabiei]
MKTMNLIGFLIFISNLGNELAQKDINEDEAKGLFCSQTQFDSISFDGDSIHFTVNRISNNLNNLSKAYAFDEFRLRFVESSNQFQYSYALNSFENLIALGGFFIDRLGIYLSFVHDHSPRINEDRRLLFCCHQRLAVDHPREDLGCSHLHKYKFECSRLVQGQKCSYLSRNCLDQADRFLIDRIIPKNIFEIFRQKSISFVYEPKLEKVLILSNNQSGLFLHSSSKIFQKNQEISDSKWSIEPIHSRLDSIRIDGAFVWKSIHPIEKNKIFVIGRRTHLNRSSMDSDIMYQILLEQDSKRVRLGQKVKSWKKFFGCYDHYGHTIIDLRSSSTPEKHRVFLIYLVSLMMILMLSIGLFLGRNLLRRSLRKLRRDWFIN